MATIDLPAHNVYDKVGGGGSGITIVGGPEALATTDTSSYVDLPGSGFVGGKIAIGATGAGVGGGNDVGYGVFTGTGFISAVFVALGYRTGGHDVSEPTRSSGASGFYSAPVNKSPALVAYYTGHTLHEALADFPIGSGASDAAEVTVPVNRQDFVPSPGPSGTGSRGICPEWDWDSIDATETATIRVYYMAIRVTYDAGGAGGWSVGSIIRS